ncbi:serine/threonine-protein kinase [Hyalangium versicolor]|uniref:serine/threonine-protein kinase n=1 Tax=Hyalangium versicolor TaxID=2861190 RepID=UPI001CCE8A4B|nr:serine/threonine-protein kinase [Hyalangium versicolor]
MSQEVALPAAPKRRGRRHASISQVGPGTDVGSYAVQAPLGAGGFGTVFRAQRGGQAYALKLLELAEVGPSAIREVLALSLLNHPNVVGLHGFWQWPDEHPRYLVVVMEYVPGRQLDVWTAMENPSALRMLKLLLGAARALKAVHAAGLVHCDVKEANLIVREPEQELVLVDFGVSGQQRSSPDAAGGWPRGTADYRSPEAWRFWHSDAQARAPRYQHTEADDLYALGVVLYWLLTDVRPFITSISGGVKAVMERMPEPPRERNPRVPEELSQLCLSLLDKRPEARPRAAAVCQQVEEWLTRRGEAWEQSLCQAFSEHNLTTEAHGPIDEVGQWLKRTREQERRPRRGLRPPRPEVPISSPVPQAASEAALPPLPAAPPSAERVASPEPAAGPPERPPDAEPVLPGASGHERTALAEPGVAQPSHVEARAAPAPVPPADPAQRRLLPRLRRHGVVGLSLLAVAALLSLLLPQPWVNWPFASNDGRGGLEPVAPTRRDGWKVAPLLNPPEAERADPDAPEVTSAAPVAPGATAQEHEASVNREQKKQPKRLDATKKAAAMVGVCTALSCSGPGTELRPPPVTAEPCPPGSLEAMEQLGIRIGTIANGILAGHIRGEPLQQVKEGQTTMRLNENLGQLEDQTVLSGRIILSEKFAWGHFVQATWEGRTYPVCLEWKHPLNDAGQVESSTEVQAVRAFK